MSCDLHMHSTVSDGSLGVDELIKQVHASGVRAFALTDHDSVDGLPRAAELASELGLETISGIELSTHVERIPVHILGYGFDTGHPALLAQLAELLAARQGRIPAMVACLGELGAPLDLEEVLRIAGEGSPGRPHVARALVEAGHCRDMGDAFQRFLGDGQPAAITKRVPTAFEAVRLINEAGGKAVWAHPLARPIQRTGGVAQLTRDLQRAGLWGLEVAHPSHHPDRRKRLRKLCRELGLGETGGSDFHGENSPGVSLGDGRGGDRVPYVQFEQLLS